MKAGLFVWIHAAVGFGPVPYRRSTYTYGGIFGDQPCTVFGELAPNSAEHRKVCTNTDGRCSAIRRPPRFYDSWCMAVQTTDSNLFLRDLYNNGMRMCKLSITSLSLTAAAQDKLSLAWAPGGPCLEDTGQGCTPQPQCRSFGTSTGKVQCWNPTARGYNTKSACESQPNMAWCDRAETRYRLKTELDVLPTMNPTATESSYFNNIPNISDRLGLFTSCEDASTRQDMNYFQVICNAYEYGAEDVDSRPNDYKTRDATGLAVRGSKICSEVSDLTTSTTTTTTTTTTVPNPRCVGSFVVCQPLEDGTRPPGCPFGVPSSESRAVASAPGVNMENNACADYCSGVTRAASLCFMSRTVSAKAGVATTCRAVYDETTPALDVRALASSAVAASFVAPNTVLSVLTCTAVVDATVCTPPGGAGWTECYATEPVCGAGNVCLSRFTLLHFPTSASYLFITTGVGQQAGPCPRGTFPECMQAQAGVSVVRRYRDPDPRSKYRTWVMVGMRGATGGMKLVLNACQARAGCHPDLSGLDYADADGGGERPFGSAIAGLNMSSVFWSSDNPLCNLTNGTVVSFVRMRDYDENTSAVDSYGELDRLGLPDPREGMADCKTKYYCMPGPCRVLDMNYFADPSYTNRFLEDSEWLEPSPRNMFRQSVGSQKGMVEMRGRSQCDPTFGTQKVFYKGEVFDPKNVSQRNPNAAAPGSYRYMSTPDTDRPLWPDVLPVPSPYAMPRTPGNNPNPEWMFDNSSMWNTPGSPRKRYRCEDANGVGSPGLRHTQPVLWLEPVKPCALGGPCAGPTVMYRATTTFNKTAFTEAAAYWNSEAGCEAACRRAPVYRQTTEVPGAGDCKTYCALGPGSRRQCSTPKDGMSGWCADMGQEQFGYTYEAFHYWGEMSEADKTTPVQFSPMHVGCQAQAGDTPKALRPVPTPFVAQFLDGACYKTSTGLHRLPHGVLSTPYGAQHDFAMVTTYPQAAINSETSHPGVFSSHAQAIGIMYPPHLYGRNASAEARAKLRALNPFIAWDEDLLLPEWNETSCQVFTSTDAVGSGCSMVPRAVATLSPGCGEGGNDADVGNTTAVPTPPLTRFVQYALNLMNVDLNYSTHGDEWKNLHDCVECENAPCWSFDYNSVTWETFQKVKGTDADDDDFFDFGQDRSYYKWQECTDNLIHSWEGYTDNGPNHIADQLASLPSGQGYAVDEMRLIDAFWTVFLPGGPRPPMPLPATPVDAATQEAFEGRFAQWGLSTAKGAARATTDVLSTFGMKTYSPNCYFEWELNACTLADHCLVPGDRWADPQAYGYDQCPRAARFYGESGERYWDTRGMPTGWYARSRTPPTGKWNTFAMTTNQRERATASFEIGRNAFTVGDKIGALYGFMQKNETANNRQTVTSPFTAPHVEWWGYNGVGRNPPAFEHVVEGTRLGSEFGFLDVATGFECTNAFASWEPATLPTDALHAASSASVSGLRAPTGRMECMADDTATDASRNDTLDTAFDRVFGRSSSTRNGSFTTLMTRDVRLVEHLTYVDALEDERPEAGTQTFRWWLGGTAVSLRASHFPQPGGGVGPHGRMKEMVKNAYAAVLVLNRTGGARDGVSERPALFSGTPTVPAHMGDSSLVHGQDGAGSKRYLHGPNVERDFCPAGVVASRGDYFERCVKVRFPEKCAVEWASGARVVMQEQATCLRPTPGWHEAMFDRSGAGSATVGASPLEIAFIGDTVQQYGDAIVADPGLDASGKTALDTFVASHCVGGGVVCETLRVTQDTEDVGFGLAGFEMSTGVSAAIERAYPGLKMNTSNLAWMQFVNEYEVATFYTGWAPATKRTWSAAVQNSEQGSGFACDCNTGVPRFFCERFALDELVAAGLGAQQLSDEMRQMHEGGTGPRQDSVDLLQCSLGWQQSRDESPIGLYLWSEKRELEVLQTDLFHGVVPGPANGTLPHIPLATSLMADGGFTEHIADKVTFSGYSPDRSHPNVVSHTTYPTTCVRWPYGQVHINSFTQKGRDKWYPADFDPRDALMGYCEKYAGKFVHCRRDGMSLEQRTAFCDRNPMASYVFLGFVLRETRSPEDVCSASRHLCIVVPGYGTASSVAAALKMVAAGGTVLVAPFGKEHITFAMHTQWYRRIGSNPTMAAGTRVPSQMLSVWDDNVSSPIGVHAAHDAVSILAHLDDDTSVDQAISAMTRYWDDLMDPNGGAQRVFNDGPVCAADEISVPGENNGVESVRCIKREAVHQPITEAELVASAVGVTLTSAVRSVPLVFGGAGNTKSCVRVKVEAAEFTLGPAVFNQASCVCPDVHTHTPVVVYGATATNFTAVNLSVVGANANVAVAALGGYGSINKGTTIVDVSGFRAAVSGSAAWCAAFARAVGVVRLDCVDSTNILVQSPRPGLSVDVRDADGAELGTAYTLTNITDYTNVFSIETESSIYHRPVDVSSTAWLFASLLVALAVATWFVNVLLWFSAQMVMATIAEEMLDKTRFVGDGIANNVFEIYMDTDGGGEGKTLIRFLEGSESANKLPQSAFVVASKILFTSSDCYDEYTDLIDHVYSSLK